MERIYHRGPEAQWGVPRGHGPASPFRGSLLHVADQFLCLGEGGTLLWLKLTPKGPEILQRKQLFRATQTWSTPAIHRGLVYISQHYKDLTGTKTGPRLLCYDFRTAHK